MDTFFVQLKRHPHLFCGKKNPSYAFKCDQDIANRIRQGWDKNVDEALQVNAHWFKPQKYAKIWTSATPLKAMFTYASDSPSDTFNEYQIYYNGQPISLDELRKMK